MDEAPKATPKELQKEARKIINGMSSCIKGYLIRYLSTIMEYKL